MTSLALLTAPAADAQGFHKKSACGAWPKNYHTNSWNAFSGHRVAVSLGACTNGTHVLWAKNPYITFPTRNPVTGALEDLELVSGPKIVKKTWYIGGVRRIRWRFSVKQHISMTPMSQTFDFPVDVFPLGSKICFAGRSCDKTKRW